jgi:hypothetical protein
MATPTMKTKKGNTRSVGVQPFQCACSRGQYEDGPSPGLFTRIIAAIVIPRNKSSDINRVVSGDCETLVAVAAWLIVVAVGIKLSGQREF